MDSPNAVLARALAILDSGDRTQKLALRLLDPASDLPPAWRISLQAAADQLAAGLRQLRASMDAARLDRAGAGLAEPISDQQRRPR